MIAVGREKSWLISAAKLRWWHVQTLLGSRTEMKIERGDFCYNDKRKPNQTAPRQKKKKINRLKLICVVADLWTIMPLFTADELISRNKIHIPSLGLIVCGESVWAKELSMNNFSASIQLEFGIDQASTLHELLSSSTSCDLSSAATLDLLLPAMVLLALSDCGSSQASLTVPRFTSAGVIKQSIERPGTLNATSSIVHVSSILVLLWLMATSPNRKRLTTERPECAIIMPSTGR